MNKQPTPIFFPVSVLKLVVMSTVTLGFYEVFWFYKNWKLIKSRNSSNIIPIARAIFSGIFFYPLIKEIKDSANSRGTSANYSPFLLTLIWIGLIVSARLPDPYWLVTMLSVLVMIPVQKTVNQLNYHVVPEHNPNSDFSAWNIVGIVLGGMLLVLAIIGTFLPE
jgi:hypothetical protein